MNFAKLKKQLDGQKGLLQQIEAACKGVEGIIWFHVSSKKPAP